MGEVQLESTITCPYCGHAAIETMPTDACVGFYPCKRCGEMLRPKEDHSCPPVQEGGSRAEVEGDF